MIFIVYSESNSTTIAKNFGNPEYSYYFVLKEFVPLLQRLGRVIVVTEPEREVDPIYDRAVADGDSCVFFSFTPPHRTPRGLACPTVPVFAWEFDTIPYETWFGERFQDWRYVLNGLGRAITHSNFSMAAVRKAMGLDFPVVSIPARVWDRFATQHRPPDESPLVRSVELSVDADVVDSQTVDWSKYSPQQAALGVGAASQAEKRAAAPVRLTIEGVVYTSIVSSYDDRKNCFDMIEGFCWALRECEDATLILKMGHSDSSRAVDALMQHLYRLTPFKCRVIIIDGYLNAAEYERLMRSTSFAVNSSTGEGQCLPLMEYMSYGIPAVAPPHTGMADYISADNAFLVNSTIALATWPQDPRGAYRTLSRRIDCESLAKAYGASYRVAKEAPERYRAMGEHARQALERHCSSAVVLEKLRSFLQMAPRAALADADFGKIAPRDITLSPGTFVNFVGDVESCRFLTSGWSRPELGYGVWSDAPVSELTFRIEPTPTRPLLLRANLSAFVNQAKTSQTLDVSVNEVPLARWTFDFASPEKFERTWRDVLIPLEVALRGEIRVTLCFKDLTSPQQLGLSTDTRLLGVTLHELSFLPQPLQASARDAAKLDVDDLRLVPAAYADELVAAQHAISKLQSEIAEVLASKSYRLGHAIVLPAAYALRAVTGALALIVASLRNPRDAFRLWTVGRMARAAAMLLHNPLHFHTVSTIHASRLRSPAESSEELVPPECSPAAALECLPAPPRKSSPLVSILIVNFNGRRHLEALFGSLSGLAFENYETIMIDNGSSDGSVELVRSRYPTVRLIALEDNVGFAEANNIGFEVARGDYICLLNNDTRCDPDFLTHLVDTLENDPGLGAVGPKIRFWSRFLPIEIDVPLSTTLFVDIDELYKGMSDYRKAFFPAGFSEPFVYRGKSVRCISGTVKLLLPEESVRGGLKLHVLAETPNEAITVRSGSRRLVHELAADCWQVISLSAGGDDGDAEWLINNAGSRVTSGGEASDRGFASADNGAYDVADEPEALCACAVLIRRDALNENEPLFAKELFAYFEDTDLSLRLRRNGFRLAYCPKSIVYHKHASTSVEESAVFKYYVNRNRILFCALHFPEQLWKEKIANARRELVYLKQRYQSESCTQDERDFAQKIDTIFAEWKRLLPQIEAGRFYDRKRHFPRLAVYNSYWNTKGGGEYHASVVAEALQTLGPVDLICEHDFSVDDVGRQFDIDLSGCRKLIVSAAELHHDVRVTGRYDVFINSTYGSDLISNAKLNFYIVSFPFRTDNRPPAANRFLNSYDAFLANSNYTKAWCRNYWHVDAKTLYPSVQTLQRPARTRPNEATKSKIILNVGRFFTRGHNKKQLELVEVFKSMIAEGRLSPGWKLVLVGQVQHGQEDYYDTVRAAAGGMPVELHPNLAREELTKLYEKAAIYWHATGLGENLQDHPELAEHFGITTIEAMSFGCVPVVIGAGGQPEIVEDNVNGYLFAGVDDLKEKTAYVARAFEADANDAFLALSAKARARAADFSREHSKERFLALLAAAREGQTARAEIFDNGLMREKDPYITA